MLPALPGLHRDELAEWFAAAGQPAYRSDQLLDWIEETGQRFLGVDVAQTQDDGSWLLIDEGLDLSRQTENFEAVRRGRQFIAEYDGKGRMFAPVWQDRGE